MTSLQPSRYNFVVHGQDGDVGLFNASTGAVLRLSGRDTRSLTDCLMDPKQRLSTQDFADELLGRLKRGGFIVAAETDEVATIRERYWLARGETPTVLTITTTMNCNLGCYYCYEERSGDRLELTDVSAVVDLAHKIVTAGGRRSLHVDWYGGEPLLNIDFLEAASNALQSYCADAGLSYVASIISNGTLWPSDIEGFVARNRIRQAQISFDGLTANHNKRRRYRKEFGQGNSFDAAVALVDRLVQCTRVDLRFNIDRGNQDDLLPFVAFARARGWFGAAYPAVLQPARLASYSGSSAFMRNHELTLEEFDALRASVRAALADTERVEESEVPDGVLRPKSSVCAALATHSIVVGAEGHTYRCGLQVGEKRRAVGGLSSSRAPAGESHDAGWWEAFDPTVSPSCSRCSFLPVCWGGCPKKHLEADDHAIQEQGRYWRTNLPRLVAGSAKIADPIISEVPLEQQFR